MNVELFKPINNNIEFEQEEKLKLQRDSKTQLEKASSWLQNFSNESTIFRAFSEVKDNSSDAYERDDKHFQEVIKNNDYLEQLLNSKGLDISEGLEIGERSKNYVHFERLVTEKLVELEKQRKINETLGMFGQVTSTIAGRSDLDILTGVGLLGMISKVGMSVGNATRLYTGIETGSSIIKTNVYDDMTLKDGFMDMLINTSVAIPSFNAFKPIVKQTTEEAITNSANVSDKVISNIESKILPKVTNWRTTAEDLVSSKTVSDLAQTSTSKEFMSWYKEKQRLQAIVKDEFYGQQKITGKERTKADFDARVRELEAKGRTSEQVDLYEELLVQKERARQSEELLITLKENERNKQLLYYQKVFSSEKYNEFRNNRVDFYAHQNELVSNVKKEELKARAIESEQNIIKINDEIKIHKSTIKSLESKVKEVTEKLKTYTNNAVIARETKKLDRLKGEIKNAKKLLYDTKKGISVKLDSSVIESIRTENRTLNQMVDDIAVALEPNINRLTDELSDISKSSLENRKSFIEEYTDILNVLNEAYPAHTKRLSRMFNDLKTKNKALSILTATQGLTRKQKTAITAVTLLGGSSLMASDGNDDGSIGLKEIVIMIILGSVLAPEIASIVARAKDSSLKTAILEATEGVREASKQAELMQSSSYKSFGKFYETAVESFDSKFTNTLTGLKGFKIPELEKLFKDILFDPLDGNLRPLEAEIKGRVHKEIGDIEFARSSEYRNWLDEHKIGPLDSYGNKELLTARFNKEIYNHMTGIKISDSEAVKNASKAYKNMFERIKKMFQESSVYGSKILDNAGEDYVTRLWNFEDLSRVYNKATDAEKNELIVNFSNMIKDQSNAISKAKQMLNWIGDSKNVVGREASDIIDRLSELFKEGTDLQQAQELLRTQKDVGSRLKARIDMDLSQWKDMYIDGEKITLDTLVNRNIADVSETYLRQSIGMIALSRRGIDSVFEFRKYIENATKGHPKAQQAQKYANTALDLVLGNRVDLGDPDVVAVAQMLKEATFTATLPLVWFSMIVELGKSVAYAGLPMTLKNISALMSKVPKESEIVRQVMDATNLGWHQANQRLDIRGIDTLDLQRNANTTALGRVALKAQEATAKISGLLKFTDISQRIVALKFSTDFANLVKGLPNDIPKSRFEVYGINDDVLKMFDADDFEFLPNGELKALDTTKWSDNKKAIFEDIAFKVNQDYVPETLISTVGMWSKSNSFGQSISFLTSYGSNLFSTQARRDAHLRDGRAMWNNAMTFALTYIGMHLRAEATGKEYTHEELVQFSLLNLPVMGVIGTMRSISDPAMFSFSRKVKQDIEDAIAGITDGTE